MPTLSVSGGEIHYEDRGDGRPIVFVHGGWLDGTFWSRQVREFSSEYRTIVPDLRGHGRTGATEPRRYSVELFADDLAALCEELSLRRPILCGLSLGSMVAGAYAARDSTDPAGVVLASPVRSMPPSVPGPVKAFTPTLPALATALATYGSEHTFRLLASSIDATIGNGSTWLALDRDAREDAYATAGRIPRREFRKVFGALYRHDAPSLSSLAEAEIPTRVLYGDAEAPPVKRQAREVVDEADGDLYEVPDAAHLLNRDAPAAFDRHLETFLEKTNGAS
ncbi:MAG: alpha/beta fold hydrolase [Haloferacaceae archaeon]